MYLKWQCFDVTIVQVEESFDTQIVRKFWVKIRAVNIITFWGKCFTVYFWREKLHYELYGNIVYVLKVYKNINYVVRMVIKEYGNNIYFVYMVLKYNFILFPFSLCFMRYKTSIIRKISYKIDFHIRIYYCYPLAKVK